MSSGVEKRNKHLTLNQGKLDLAKKLHGSSTDTETVEPAPDAIITEAEKDKKAASAHQAFIKSEAGIRDAFGNLQD